MEKFPAIAPLIKKYPKAAGSLFTTYNDLLLGKIEHLPFLAAKVVGNSLK